MQWFNNQTFGSGQARTTEITTPLYASYMNVKVLHIKSHMEIQVVLLIKWKHSLNIILDVITWKWN